MAAVDSAEAGDTVFVAPGTFELTESLHLPPGLTLSGSGAGQTIIRNAPSWAPGTAGLDADEGAYLEGVDCSKYLLDLGRDQSDFTVTGMTLSGPQLYGAVCGIAITDLTLTDLKFDDFLWSGVRTFLLKGATITNNEFVDAGGRREVTEGASGGGLFLTYASEAEIAGNRFSVTDEHPSHYYGIKGREARDVHIHHNTIATDFSIELPFENDWNVEIDHNFLGGTVSVPRSGGGEPPEGVTTFHLHHNYFQRQYSLEFQRNAIEVDHNLFGFSAEGDYGGNFGNLVSGFDATPASRGGADFHENLIDNPGLGIYWNEGVYNDFTFRNNEVRGATPRTEGLFDFRPERDGVKTDWSTIRIVNNIVTMAGEPRPLMRSSEGRSAVIRNNTLTGINDADGYANPDTGQPRGLSKPLSFRLGADDEYTVDQWELSRTAG